MNDTVTSLNQISIRARLIGLTVLGVVGMVAVLALSFVHTRNAITEERSHQVNVAMDIAMNTIKTQAEAAEKGTITEEQAKKNAMDQIRTMRYLGSEYLWIHSASNGQFIMHPIKQTVIGKPLDTIVDAEGRHFVAEALEKVKKSTDKVAWQDYVWPRPGSDEPEPKLSYFVAYEPWGWVVATGMYTNANLNDALGLLGQLALWVLPLIVLLSVVGFFIMRSVTTPLKRTMHTLASSSLSAGLMEKTGNELHRISATIHRLFDSLERVQGRVGHSTHAVTAATHDLRGVGDGMSRDAHATERHVDDAAAAFAEMRTKVDVVNTSTESIAEAIRNISESTTKAANVADEAATTAATTANMVSQLGESSQEISSVIKTITSIAEQTNLLALNATIEAARAGDAGKGFAVVANEVKELARESAEASEDITTKVEAMQTDVASVVAAISSITDVVHSIHDYQTAIAGAVEEQHATTQEITHSVQAVVANEETVENNLTLLRQAAHNTSSLVDTVRTSVDQLGETTQGLESAVSDLTTETSADVSIS